MSGALPSSCEVRRLGIEDYEATAAHMRDFTQRRMPDTPDAIWLLQHRPVYTLGQAGKPEHVLDAHGIPVVRSDRGGQVTYHGPGQLIAYLLLDVRRRGLGVRSLVELCEQAVIRVLADYGIAAEARRDAPGVYVGGAKIAALGLRIRNGRSYHGLSFNIDMDLAPFTWINPCGYAGLRSTQLRDLLDDPGPGLFAEAEERLLNELLASLALVVAGDAGRGCHHPL